jgi:TRAP-type mannitol/chloroaromatic compound transport system permease small subunit
MQFRSVVYGVTRVIDTFTLWCGRVFSWLALVLMLAIVYHVVMRYGFNAPTVWAYDVTYMLYGTMFMLGAAYCLLKGGHVRTDFIYNRFPPRWQGIIDAVLYIILFFPAMYLFFIAGYDYAARSWAQLERGFYSPWAPPIYPFKTVIPVAITLLVLQGISELLKSLHAAIYGRWP